MLSEVMPPCRAGRSFGKGRRRPGAIERAGQNPNLNNDWQLLRSIGPNGLFELGIAPAAPSMNSLSALVPHPGEQLQKQRPADAPGGVEQEPDSEQPNHVRRQSSGFERHDDEHVDEGQRYAADDGRSHPIACPGEEARHDEDEDDPPYAAPERLRENLGNADRRHWLHAESRNCLSFPPPEIAPISNALASPSLLVSNRVKAEESP